MAVISITLTESSLQLIAGIPKYVTIEVSIPSTIFYTLDGSEPDVNSAIYLNSLSLPTNASAVTLKLFATNGTDSSAVLTKSYLSSFVGLRQSHDKILNASSTPAERDNLYPFGNIGSVVPPQYGNTAGLTVDSENIENIPDGYDGTGTGTQVGGTDLELSEYDLIFSETNSIGERGHGIGTLPANVVIRIPTPSHPSTSSNTNSRHFNPRALVIYQDSSDTPIDPEAPQINKQFFSTDNHEVVRNGAHLFNTGLDNMQPTGSFLRAHFNPREQKITYYYHDPATLRWIISKEPYQPAANAHNLSNIVFSSRQDGSGLIFKWIPFVGRRLI